MNETARSKGYKMVECLFVEEKKEVYNSRGLPSSFNYVSRPKISLHVI